MIQTNQGSHFRDDVVQEFTSQTCIYNIFHEKRESSFGSKTIDTMITSQSLRKHRIDFSNNISENIPLVRLLSGAIKTSSSNSLCVRFYL